MPRQRWRITELLAEGHRDFRSGGIRTLAVALLLVGCLALYCYVEVVAATSARELYDDQLSRGSDIVAVLTDGTLSWSRCASLNSVSGVRAAGPVRRDGLLIRMPGPSAVPFQRVQATPSTIHAIRLSDAVPRAEIVPGATVVGGRVGQELGFAGSQGTVPTHEGGLNVDHTLRVNRRAPAFERWVIHLSALPLSDVAEECWVAFDSPAGEAEVAFVNWWLGDGADGSTALALPSDDLLRDPVTELAERPSRRGSGTLMLLLLGFASLETFTRRDELATRRLTGTTLSELSIMQLAYFLPTLSAGLVAGAIAVVLIGPFSLSTFAFATRGALLAVLGCVVLLPATALFAVRKRVLQLLKE